MIYSHGIYWERTGEILDKISVYDYDEVVEGCDRDGHYYNATASISCDVIIAVTEVELIDE